MASGDRGTASDSSNIGHTVGSFVEGEIGSLAGSEVSQHVSSLGASIWGAIGGTGK
jgi:hypothetical protein